MTAGLGTGGRPANAHQRPVRPVGVLVVDDHAAFLSTAVTVVEATPDFEVVATATTAAGAFEQLRHHTGIDLVLLDVNLPDHSGVEIARRYAAAGGTALVVLMSTADPADLPEGALDEAVARFLPKEHLSPASLGDLWQQASVRRPAGE